MSFVGVGHLGFLSLNVFWQCLCLTEWHTWLLLYWNVSYPPAFTEWVFISTGTIWVLLYFLWILRSSGLTNSFWPSPKSQVHHNVQRPCGYYGTLTTLTAKGHIALFCKLHIPGSLDIPIVCWDLCEEAVLCMSLLIPRNFAIFDDAVFYLWCCAWVLGLTTS